MSHSQHDVLAARCASQHDMSSYSACPGYMYVLKRKLGKEGERVSATEAGD